MSEGIISTIDLLHRRRMILIKVMTKNLTYACCGAAGIPVVVIRMHAWRAACDLVTGTRGGLGAIMI